MLKAELIDKIREKLPEIPSHAYIFIPRKWIQDKDSEHVISRQINDTLLRLEWIVYYDITNQKKELRNLTYLGRKKLIERMSVEELVESEDYKVVHVTTYGLPKELKSSLHRLLSDNHIYDSKNKSAGNRKRRPVGDSGKYLSRLFGKKYDPNREIVQSGQTTIPYKPILENHRQPSPNP